MSPYGESMLRVSCPMYWGGITPHRVVRTGQSGCAAGWQESCLVLAEKRREWSPFAPEIPILSVLGVPLSGAFEGHFVRLACSFACETRGRAYVAGCAAEMYVSSGVLHLWLKV
jgi:hypothetical protein